MAVDVRVEAAAVLGHLPHPREREDLEPAGVGEYRAVPAHEAVQPAGGGDDLRPGAEEQVVRVAQDDLRAELDEVARPERLDGAEGSDVHEDRRLDDAVRGGQTAKPGVRPRILM